MCKSWNALKTVSESALSGIGYLRLFLDMSLLLAPVKVLLMHGSGQRSLFKILAGSIIFMLVTASLYLQFASFSTTVIFILLVSFSYANLLQTILPRLRNCFTAGETLVIADMIILFTTDALSATLKEVSPGIVPHPLLLSVREPIHVFIHSLVFGMLFIGLTLHSLLRKAKAVRSVNTDVDLHRKLSLLFFAGASLIVLLIIRPWTAVLLNGKDPFIWLIEFLNLRPFIRYPLLAYWASSVSAAVVLSFLFFNLGSGHIESSPKAVNNRRKFFHAVAVLMFVPGYLLDAELMHLSFSVAISALIMIEYIRYFRLWPVGDQIQGFLTQFLDKRDAGTAILSHLYLLLGCAFPVWLNRIPNKVTVAGLLGVLTLGVGDSMASLVGFRIGHTKWPNSSKSIEGTIAFCTSLFLCLSFLDPTPGGLFNGAITSILTGLLEAFSEQNDNLVIPLYALGLLNTLS